jgi:hypothetical protein
MLSQVVGAKWIVLAAAGASAAIAASALASSAPLTVAPTPAQRAAILHAFGDPKAANRCLTARLAASNHKYATVRFRTLRSCRRSAFNGVNVLKRVKPGHWRVVFEGSAFRCPLAGIPRGVQRDLGVCPG